MKKLFPLLLIFCLTFNLFGETPFVLALSKPEKPTAPANPLEEVTITPTPSAFGGPTETPTPLPKPSKPSKPRTMENTEGTTEDTDGSTKGKGVEAVSSPNSQNSQNTANGANSENTSTVEQSNETNISQENQLYIENNFQIEADTCDNFANYSAGDAEISTGDANVSLTLVNSGNENTVGLSETNPKGCGGDCGTPSTAKSQDNGAFSENTTSSETNDTTTIDSENEAEVKNNFAVSSQTGDNNANYTTGGDAKIQTGNAATTINVINFANTNGVEVAVKEFNILDDQTGDVTLDFSDAQVIAANSGNGASSTNKTTIDDTGTIALVNENNAKVENEIVLTSDTGGNNANFTTGGDAAIQTGDANIVVNVINFLNNNLTAVGEVVVGVVNIFGNLVGDLILPGNAINLGNGAESVNSAEITAESSETIIQSNTADIKNSVELTANTGDNNTNYNTGGDAQITTGQTNISVSATTIANENLVASSDTNEPIYVVLINEMGKWVGKVLGVTNEGNGAESSNSAEVNLIKDTTIVQENTAAVENNIMINANTGDNSTSYTTDGNASIQTGDVNVLTNIVNFLNNNFVGKKIILSIVNVFGSWVGDLVTTENTEKNTENAEDLTEKVDSQIAQITPIPQTPQNPESISSATGGSDGQSASWRTQTETDVILPSSPFTPSTPSFLTEESQAGQTEEEETTTKTETETVIEAETVLDLIADIGQGEVNLKQKLFSQSLKKKVIEQEKKIFAQQQIRPSPWANRKLLPTITDEIKLEENGRHLPWNFSSAILMALGLIAGILKRFFT